MEDLNEHWLMRTVAFVLVVSIGALRVTFNSFRLMMRLEKEWTEVPVVSVFFFSELGIN